MNRIKQLKEGLRDLDAIVIENPVDLHYITGLSMSKGRLTATKKNATLFVDGRYYSIAQEKAPCSVEKEEKFSVKGRVGFDAAWTSFEAFQGLKTKFPTVEWIALSQPLKWMRAVKEKEEITALKKAADLTRKGIKLICSLLKEGISEQELAFEFEFFCRKQGSSGMSFEPIIAFGENGAYPHHRSTPTRLKRDQMVLIDVGAIVDGYRGDLTHMESFGSPPEEIVLFDKLALKAQKAARDLVKPGIKARELDQAARAVFRAAGVEELFTHGLGHGVGMETHEFPLVRSDGKDKDVEMLPGMVFTIEPGLYKPGLGGVRREEMVLVTEKGHSLV